VPAPFNKGAFLKTCGIFIISAQPIAKKSYFKVEKAFSRIIKKEGNGWKIKT